MYTEKKTIFIDGSSGTAGLRIYDRLAQRADITLLTLPPELGHDIEAQREMLNRADIAFLCLPDAAAITAADLVENPDTVVLDTSTAPRQYALTQQHKHLREMCAVPGLTHAPVFAPIVADFYSGMETSVALFGAQLCPGKTMADIKAAYAAKYTGPVVHYQDPACADGFLSAAAMSGKDSMVVSVSGNDERIVLTSVFDNLGKGASGAALECLNLVMGKEKGFGLDL